MTKEHIVSRIREDKDQIDPITKESVIVIEEINSISDEIYSLYLDKIRYIKKWVEIRKLFDALIMNGNEFKEYLATTRDQIKSTGLSASYDEIFLFTTNVNRLMLNLLTVARTFVDHGNNNIQKKFGKGSKEIDEFTNILRYEFDNNFEYRFMYKLRNFSQHCGMPCLNINSSSSEQNPVFDLDVNFDIEGLLDEYDSWGVLVEKDLKEKLSSGESICLDDFLESLMDCFDEIMGKVDLIFKKSLDEAFDLILEIIKCPEGPLDNCDYAFFEPKDYNEYEDGTRKLNFQINSIEYKYYKIFKANLYPDNYVDDL